jgi:hypothetical protein
VTDQVFHQVYSLGLIDSFWFYVIFPLQICSRESRQNYLIINSRVAFHLRIFPSEGFISIVMCL